MSMEARYIKLRQLIRGWVNYFKIANMGKIAQKLDEWIRRRIRMAQKEIQVLHMETVEENKDKTR